MSSIPKVKLNTGVMMSAIGFGTWKIEPSKVASSVETAIKAGYRKLDCAWEYQNEQEVCKGIKAAGIPRDELFITSKVHGTYHTRVEEGVKDSLNRLGTSYLDLLLMHYPLALNPEGNDPVKPKRPDGKRDIIEWDPFTQTYPQMEKLVDKGLVKAIGVANFSIPNLELLLATAQITPAVNQVENHPWLPQPELVEFCKTKGIQVEAYSPLGSANAPLMKEQAVLDLSKKYDCDPSVVLLSFQIKRGLVPIVKSQIPDRIKSNLQYIDIEDEDVEKLLELHKIKGIKRHVRPKWGKEVKLRFDDWWECEDDSHR